MSSRSRNTENAIFEWLGKETTRYFCGFESSFQNSCWNIFNTSGLCLSQSCKIRCVWNLPSSFSKNTLIPCSGKDSLIFFNTQKFVGQCKIYPRIFQFPENKFADGCRPTDFCFQNYETNTVRTTYVESQNNPEK
jgi:hypothetical protein